MRRLIFFIAFLIPFSVNSQMAVTDPGSYMYYMEEIAATLEMVDNGVKQVESLGGIKDKVEGMYGSMNGIYNRAKGLNSRLKRTEERVADVPGNVTEINPSYGSTGSNDGGWFKKRGMRESKEDLDKHFVDPRSAKRNAPGERDKRYEVRQAAFVSNLSSATAMLEEMPERLKTLQTLSSEIDRTENIKDSQDLTNRFLVEMLETLNLMLVVLSHQSQADSLSNYEGVDEEITEKRKKQFDNEYVVAEQRLDNMFRKAGVKNINYKQAEKKIKYHQL